MTIQCYKSMEDARETEVKEYPEEAIKILNQYFPKKHKCRGKAMVILASAFFEGQTMKRIEIFAEIDRLIKSCIHDKPVPYEESRFKKLYEKLKERL